MAMLIAVCGVGLVSFGTQSSNDADVNVKWYGYVLCVVSTIVCAAQSVSTGYVGSKHFRKHMEIADNFLLMVGMGLFAFLCFWPGMFILSAMGVEELVLPKNFDEMFEVLTICAMELVFSGGFMTGIALSGPIFMSLGTLSVIPLSFVADVWLHGLQITVSAVIGSILIIFSFVLIEIPMPKMKLTTP